MAAVLSADMDHTDKVVTLIKECTDLGLTVLPPDVNARLRVHRLRRAQHSLWLGAVRGVGQGAAEALIAERTTRGAYSGLEDLCRRLDLQKVNRRVFEALLRAGSLDGLAPTARRSCSACPGPCISATRTPAPTPPGRTICSGSRARRAPAPRSRRGCDVAGVERGGAPGGGARDTRPVSHGHPLARFESSLARFVSHRIGDLVSDRPVAGSTAGASAPASRLPWRGSSMR